MYSQVNIEYLDKIINNALGQLLFHSKDQMDEYQSEGQLDDHDLFKESCVHVY